MKTLRLRLSRKWIGIAGLCLFLASETGAQDGGLPVDFCHESAQCSDDALEIVFESETSTYQGPVEVGVEVPIRVILDTKSDKVQGYSWAVKHDSKVLEILPATVTTDGTIIDPKSPDTALRRAPFLRTAVVEGGFYSAVALSLFEDAALPLGRNTLCLATYRFTARPECTVLRFVHRVDLPTSKGRAAQALSHPSSAGTPTATGGSTLPTSCS